MANNRELSQLGSIIVVDDSNRNLGIGTTDPNAVVGSGNTAKLSVGIVSAYQLYGDATNLTGLTPGQVGALANLIEDTTPQLGGDLDVNGNNINGTGNVNLNGGITATSFTGDLTGTATTATALATARNFDITGDIVASAISFDGTGNVSLAATIQPDSVAMGTDTTGDYVESVSGTANEISVTGGTGEGSTPTIGFAANPTIGGNVTIGQDLTVTRDLQVTRNLSVDGTVTIGGTSATIFAETLKISDPDLILGIRTDANGNDISTDNTANHGGVALASTEGTPLITLVNPGAGETLPSTYKKIMWFKSGSFTGLNTDAWLSNYAFGVGTTSMSTGTKFAVGNIEADFDDITAVRDINSTGVITATTFSGSGASLTNIPNSALDNSTVSYGGIQLSLGGSDATPAFDLQDATNYPYSSLTGITTEIVGDTTPQLGGDLDVNGNDITGTGNVNLTGVITATSFDGSLATTNLTGTITNAQLAGSIENSKLSNSTVSYGGIQLSLGGSDATPAFNLSDATNYPFTSLTGITTEIVGDTTPQLGGDLDVNGNDITGTGNVNLTGIITATSFSGGGASLTSLNASNISSGTISDDRLPATITSNITGDLTGNADTATTSTNVTVADESTDTACNVLFVTAATGNLPPKSGTNLTFNSSNGTLTATTFSGSGASLTSIPNSALDNSSVSYGGIQLSLGGSDATPAFDLSDATNYPYTSLTGITTEIVGDTTPQLGGDLDVNGNDITGTGNVNLTGIITATSFVKASNSSGFLKADGTEDTSTYLTAESDTLDSVTTRGSTTTNDVGVGTITATSFIKSGGTSSQFLKADGSVDNSAYITSADGGDAATLDGLDSTSFLRSDAADTKTSGNLTFSDGVSARFGDGEDLIIWHNAADSYILHSGTGNLNIRNSNNGADVRIESDDGSGGSANYFLADGSTGESILYHYGTEKLATKSNGIDVTGHTETDTLNVSGISTFQNNVHLGDADILYLGDDNDLYLRHNGTTSEIKQNNSGTLVLENSGTTKITNSTGLKDRAIFRSTSVDLFYDDVKKFETTEYGINITGIVTATGFSTSGGTSSQFLKADGSVDNSTYLTSFTETNDLSSAVTWANVPDANITESSVTQHQAALSITESQISDLQSYLTSETQTLDDVVGLGSTTTQTISVGNLNVTGTGNTSTITGAANLVLDPAAVGDATGTVTILGNLQVDGTQTIINSTTLEVDDKLVSIAKSATDATQANGAGLEINGASATFTYASTGDKWVANKSIEATSFIKSSNSGGFLKADGTEDTNTYLTSIPSGYLQNLSEDTTPQLGGNLDVNTKNINFGDSASASDDRLNFGAGTDFSIYYNGTNGYIDVNPDSARADLYIRNNVDSDQGGNIYIQAKSGEHSIICNDDSSVNLYYDSNLKLQTNISGIDITGSITVSGTVDGRDLATDGTKLDAIEASADVTDATNVAAAGAVMESDTSTVNMSFVVDEDNMASNSATKVPTQQSVKAYVDANAGISNVVEDTTPQLGGTLETNGNVIDFGDCASFNDSDSGDDRLRFGASQDLQIYHVANSNSYIDNRSQHLYIRNAGSNNDSNIYIQAVDGENSIICLDDSSVNLYYNNNLKLQTVTAGIDVTGNITVSGTVDGRDVATDGTKLDAIEASADVTDATNVDAAGAVMESDTSTVNMSFVVDEDDMTSDSATKVPTQQSVKAYVDANAGGGSGGSGEFNTGITSSVQITPLSYETSVFTFPSTSGKQYTIESINVANVDTSVGVGTTVNIIASIEDATAGEQTYIAYNVPIVNGGVIELLKNPIVAGPSDVIKMWVTNEGYVGTNNAAEVYMNYSEYTSTDYVKTFASTVSIATTDVTGILTSTSNPTVIESIHLANRTDTGDYPVSVRITQGTSTSHLVKDLIIPRYSTVDILDRQKRIETNSVIEVKVEQTSTIDVIIAGKKITS